jgi:hypothetical protein
MINEITLLNLSHSGGNPANCSRAADLTEIVVIPSNREQHKEVVGDSNKGNVSTQFVANNPFRPGNPEPASLEY